MNSPFLLNTFRPLIYWEIPWKSAAALFTLLVLEICFLFYSCIRVVAWLGLLIMACFTVLRVYSRWTGREEDFFIMRGSNDDKRRREREERLVKYLKQICGSLLTIRDTLMIVDHTQSLKFGLFLYVLTHVGAKCNFSTILILGTILSFVAPRFYQNFEKEIQSILAAIKRKLGHLPEKSQEQSPPVKSHINGNDVHNFPDVPTSMNKTRFIPVEIIEDEPQPNPSESLNKFAFDDIY